ncbi:uncharacterized protein LOC144163374 isoform X2 [Haemaphysalis longicornis]
MRYLAPVCLGGSVQKLIAVLDERLDSRVNDISALASLRRWRSFMRSTASTGSTTACSDERLESHVDDMISAGFIEEMEEFHDSYKHRLNQTLDADYMKGIFQSIGFKESHRHGR